MSFLFLMIKIALVIYVVKFVWDVTFGLFALVAANKASAKRPMTGAPSRF
jgi:hypothetical protein